MQGHTPSEKFEALLHRARLHVTVNELDASYPMRQKLADVRRVAMVGEVLVAMTDGMAGPKLHLMDGRPVRASPSAGKVTYDLSSAEADKLLESVLSRHRLLEAEVTMAADNEFHDHGVEGLVVVPREDGQFQVFLHRHCSRDTVKSVIGMFSA